jgi:glycosyltransferase involved in cell wall biosynthesis
MNILYLTPYLPVFGSHGCASKTFDDIEMLSLRHNIHIVSFVSLQDKEKISFFKRINCRIYPFFIRSYQCLPYKCREMTETIKNIFKKVQLDILQCECSFMAKYLPPFDNVPSILTKHQIFPLYFWREFKLKKNPLMLLRIIKNIFNEKIWFSRFKKIVFFSEHDRDSVISLIKDKSKIRIIPLAIDTEYFSPYIEEYQKYDVCFLGNFSYYQNIDAMAYFIHKILPPIQKLLPNFSMVIIGDNFPQILKKFASKKNIHLTGYVKDVRLYLAMSKIFINPIRSGSGMRRKLLEAWAMAKPVVSTSVGCEGFNIVDGKNIFISNTPQEFINKIGLLIGDKKLRDSLGKEGRKIVEQYHDRRKIISSLENLYLESSI